MGRLAAYAFVYAELLLLTIALATVALLWTPPRLIATSFARLLRRLMRSREPGTPDAEADRKATLEQDDFKAITAEDVGEMARAMTAVINVWPKWVHRRVETITYEGVLKVHHRVVLEVTLPGLTPPASALRLVPSPVGLFSKEVLTGFVARDEAGWRISHPTLEENRRLTTRLLWDMMAACSDQSAGANPDHEARLVAWALTGPRKQASRASSWLLREWLPRQRPAADADGQLQTALKSLFTDLASRYYLSVLLDPARGCDRVIELSYNEYLTRPPVHRWRDRARGYQDGLVSLQTGLAASTHIEIEAPAGCQFPPNEPGHRMPVRFESALGTEAADRLAREAIAESLGPVLSISVHSPDATSTVVITNQLYLAPGSLLLPALLMSVVTGAVFLLGFAARLVEFHGGMGTASVLAVLPAVYAAVVLLPSDHRITRALELRARNAIIASAVLSLAAAASFVLTFPPTTHPGAIPLVGGVLFEHHLGWRAIWWGSLAILALLNLAAAVITYRRRRLPAAATVGSRRVSS